VRDKKPFIKIINEKAWINGKFEWQTDLEHSPTAIHIDQCYQLYQNQEEHHKKKNIQRRICRIFKIVYCRF
jgi:hypothetical protein